MSAWPKRDLTRTIRTPATQSLPNQSGPASAGDTPWLEVYGSPGLVDWLGRENLSIALTTYHTGKLLLIGCHAGKLSVIERTFDRAMGLTGGAQRLWLATL